MQNYFNRFTSSSIKFNLLSKKLKLNKSGNSRLRQTLNELLDDNFIIRKGKYYELFKKAFFYEGKIILDEIVKHAHKMIVGIFA